MGFFSRGGEFGSRTPYESRTTETKKATLKYDVGKPFLLALVSALAAVFVILSILWAIKVMGRHTWYVIFIVASFGNCAWAIWMGRRNDSAFAMTALIFGISFGIIAIAGGVVLDLLVTHYWRELLLSLLPLTFALTLCAFVWLPNFLEAVLVSPHLEQALAILVGGHDDKYDAPWWMKLYVNSVQRERLVPPILSSAQNLSGEPPEAAPELALTELDMFLALAMQYKTLSRDNLAGKVMCNGKKMTQKGWKRCIDILVRQKYIAKINGGYDWLPGQSARVVLSRMT